jgi:E3 ubiquitin-protein ligase HUWE1
VAALISSLLKAPEDRLAAVLKDIDTWKWPRTDLNAWIKVLNRFDDIMESIIREYDVEKLQLVSFNNSAKELLSEILRFERLLLEYSTNRKTFSSYDVSHSCMIYVVLCNGDKSASEQLALVRRSGNRHFGA